MTRESLHQLRVCIASLLLGVSATAQLRLFELPFVPSVVCMLAAILLFPRPRALSDGKPHQYLIALGLFVAINTAAPWWLESTGQPIQDSPWLIVPLHLWLLYALTLEAAKTIRLLPAPLPDGATVQSTHPYAS
ncbi:MAG: hypothetical protein V4673_07930 [Pseudomonadota bacterium]